jgi:hypothetical protein
LIRPGQRELAELFQAGQIEVSRLATFENRFDDIGSEEREADPTTYHSQPLALVLDRASPKLDRMERGPHLRKTRHGRCLASQSFSAVLATHIQAERATTDRSENPSTHRPHGH